MQKRRDSAKNLAVPLALPRLPNLPMSPDFPRAAPPRRTAARYVGSPTIENEAGDRRTSITAKVESARVSESGVGALKNCSRFEPKATFCPMNQPFAPAIVIAGMHRSGTSLAASIVASAGVHIGERLMGPAQGNPRGHFEDLDFFELQVRALAANGLPSEGFTCQGPISAPPAMGAEFDGLVTRRRGLRRPWGWKDPRTTLFLDAWRERLPEAVFLLIFRRPWEVVDSLLRRGDEAFSLEPRLAADVWLSYNRQILAFFLANRDRCLIAETTRVAHDPAGMIADVGRLMGVELGRPEDLYDPGLLVEDDSFDLPGLLHGMRPEAIELYESLRELAAGLAAVTSERPADVNARPEGLIDAAAMQWVRAARATDLAHHRQAELVTTSLQLANTSKRLEAISRQLEATVTERDELARSLACRTTELTADRDAALARLQEASVRIDAVTREVASLRNELLRARHRKTFRERLLIEGRRIIRQLTSLRVVVR